MLGFHVIHDHSDPQSDQALVSEEILVKVVEDLAFSWGVGGVFSIDVGLDRSVEDGFVVRKCFKGVPSVVSSEAAGSDPSERYFELAFLGEAVVD